MLKRFKTLRKTDIYKKIITVMVTGLIVLNSTTIPVHAEPDVSSLRQAVENRLSTFNQDDISNYTGELGIFYNGKRILSQAIWTQFICSDQAKPLGITNSVKEYQIDQLVTLLNTFNSTYFKDTADKSEDTGYIGLTLDKTNVDKAVEIKKNKINGSGGDVKFNIINVQNIANDLSKHINTYLDQQLSNYKNNKEELVNAKRLELRYIYDIVNAPIDEVKAINSLMPQVASTDKKGATTFSKKEYNINNECKSLTDIMSAENGKGIKAQVLRMAQEIDKDELSEINVDKIDNRKNLIDRFYKDGTQNNEELLNTYYLMLSASSVYEPFISHAGDDYFKRALMKVAGESDKTGPMWKLYSDANMYRKPLYLRQIDKDGKVSGPAERASLEGFLDSVQNDGAGALVLPIGLVTKGKDSDSYNIYSSDRFTYSNKESVDNKQKLDAQDKQNGVAPQTGQNPDGKSDADSNQNNGTPQQGTTPKDVPKDAKDENLNTNSNTGTNLNTPSDAPDANTTGPGEPVDDYLKNNNLTGEGGTTQQPTQPNGGTTDNKQTTKENPTSISTDKKVKDSLDNVEFTPDGNPITGEDKVSPPVFSWGKFKFSQEVHMGTVVMQNIIKDVTNLKDFEKQNHMLFMNAFGDIVTETNIVILPAASNPTLFNSEKSFYPYSIGFMKPYPNLKANENVFKVGKRDEDKYLLEISARNDKKTVPGSDLKYGNDEKVKVSQVSDSTNLNMFHSWDTNMGVQTNMRDMGSGNTSMFRFKHYDFKSDGWWGFAKNGWADVTTTGMFKDQYLMAKIPADVVSNGKSVVLFESDLKDLTDQDLGMIVNNYYWGIMADGDGNMTKPNGNLNTTLFSKYIVKEGLNGVTNTQVYTKNMIQNYDEKVEEYTNILTNMIRKLTKSVVSINGNVSGVLGIQGAYQEPLLGKMMVYCRTYMPYVVALGILLVLIRLITRQVNLTQACISGVIVVTVSILFTTYLPVWLPTIFNVANNNIARNLSYTSLLMKAENYDKVYSDNKDDKGNVLMSTVSVNLAKLNNEDLDYVCSKYDISKSQLSGGKSTVINYEAGIFLQGNVLKCNVDKLFKNQPIVGSYVSDKKGGVTYEIKAKKMVSSQLDYYTPYHLIVNSFTQRLNDFSSIYDLNRSTLRYKNMVKDSFMVTSYMDSAVFLVPGDWQKVLEEEKTAPHIIADMKNKFANDKDNKDPYDFIGLRTFLNHMPEKAKSTLWYKTLVQNGYIEDDAVMQVDGAKATGEDAEKAMNELVYYVNRHVKKFMLDNVNIFKGMSDENVIKVVSLYATNLLSQKGGNWGNEMYPMYLNYEELGLNDVLLSAYVSDNDRFISTNLDVVNYIFDVYGWFTLIVFALALLATSMVISICKLLIPVLYIALGIILILRFAFNNALSPVVKGYSKCCGIVFLCYTLNCLMLSALSKFTGNVWCVWLQLVFSVLLLDTLLRLCFAVLTNLNELGDSKMSVVAPTIVQKLGDLTINGTITNLRYARHRGAQYSKRAMANKYDKFKHGRRLDDLEGRVNLGKRIREYDRTEDERDDIRNDSYRR